MQKRMQKRAIKLVVILRVLLYNKKVGKYIAVKNRILRFPTAARLKILHVQNVVIMGIWTNS